MPRMPARRRSPAQTPVSLLAFEPADAEAAGVWSVRQVVALAAVSEAEVLALFGRAGWPAGSGLAQLARRCAAADAAIDLAAAAPADAPTGWHEIPGQGIDGQVGDFHLLIGSADYLEDAGFAIDGSARQTLAAHAEAGWLSLCVGASIKPVGSRAQHRSLLGIVAIGEAEPRPDEGAEGVVPAANESVRWVRSWRGVLLAMLIAGSALTGVWASWLRVEPGEVAVVERFGAYVAYCGPGRHLRPAWLFERVHRVRPYGLPVVRIGGPADAAGGLGEAELFITADGLAPAVPGAASRPAESSPGSMGGVAAEITDGRPAAVEARASIYLRVAEPGLYLQAPLRPEAEVEAWGRFVLSEVIASKGLGAWIGTGQVDAAGLLRDRLQQRLDEQATGLAVDAVRVDRLEPALPVEGEAVAEAWQADRQARRAFVAELRAAQQRREERLQKTRVETDARLAQAQAEADAERVEARARADRLRGHVAEFRADPARLARRLLLNAITAERAGSRAVLIDPALHDRVQVIIGGVTAEPHRDKPSPASHPAEPPSGGKP